MHQSQTTGTIIERAIEIHRRLGPGLLESVYQRILATELSDSDLHVAIEVPIDVNWKGQCVGEAFRADLIVNESVIVEVNSVESLHPVHPKQLLIYSRLSGLPIGLLLNFGAPLLKDGIVRVVNRLEE